MPADEVKFYLESFRRALQLNPKRALDWLKGQPQGGADAGFEGYYEKFLGESPKRTVVKMTKALDLLNTALTKGDKAAFKSMATTRSLDELKVF
jgi:hypothetical protein